MRLEKFLNCIIKFRFKKIILGLKEYKVLPLDPLKVSGISIGDAGGSVSVKQDYKNVEVHGLTRDLEKRSFKYVYLLKKKVCDNKMKYILE